MLPATMLHCPTPATSRRNPTTSGHETSHDVVPNGSSTVHDRSGSDEPTDRHRLANPRKSIDHLHLPTHRCHSHGDDHRNLPTGQDRKPAQIDHAAVGRDR